MHAQIVFYIQTFVDVQFVTVGPMEHISSYTVFGRVVRGMHLAITLCDSESLDLRRLNRAMFYFQR